MTTKPTPHRAGAWRPPDPPTAILVMLAEEDDRVVMIDLSRHPCGQHIVDDLVAGAQLVPAHHLHAVPAPPDDPPDDPPDGPPTGPSHD